jgi:hypothetical protein
MAKKIAVGCADPRTALETVVHLKQNYGQDTACILIAGGVRDLLTFSGRICDHPEVKKLWNDDDPPDLMIFYAHKNCRMYPDLEGVDPEEDKQHQTGELNAAEIRFKEVREGLICHKHYIPINSFDKAEEVQTIP